MMTTDALTGDGELAKLVRAHEQQQSAAIAKHQAALYRTIGAIGAAVAAHNAKPRRPQPPRRNTVGESIH